LACTAVLYIDTRLLLSEVLVKVPVVNMPLWSNEVEEAFFIN